MKQLRISKLMDEYTDREFFPEGGSVADPEAVRARVLAKAKAPAEKKQTPGKKKVLLAAALAAVMVVLVGAGFPSMMYGLVSGSLSFQETDDGRLTALVHYGPLVQAEEGRLWFTPDEGEPVDITDLVSEAAPYIYDGSDPDAKMTYYVVVGGTPDRYGYLEWIAVPDPFNDSGESSIVHMDGERMYAVYAYDISGPDQDNIRGSGNGPVFWEDVQDYPWLWAGIGELGIPVTTERNYTVIYGQ